MSGSWPPKGQDKCIKRSVSKESPAKTREEETGKAGQAAERRSDLRER